MSILHPEITLWPCSWGCTGCHVQQLQKLIPNSRIPRGVADSISGLLDYWPEGDSFHVWATLSTSVSISSQYIPQLIDLFRGRLSVFGMVVGDTPLEWLTENVETLVESTELFRGENIILLKYMFVHQWEDEETKIYWNFSKALDFLIHNFDKIPAGSALATVLGRTAAFELRVWSKCYTWLLRGIEDDHKTGHEKLDEKIRIFVEKFWNIIQRDSFDDDDDAGELYHRCSIPLADNKELIFSLRAGRPFQKEEISDSLVGYGDNIMPLLSTSFVAPMHSIYGMNNPENRMSNEAFLRQLSEIQRGDNPVEDYNNAYFPPKKPSV